ncbi:probable glycosyltransferase BC10 [Coccomyxa sp. Obi]|nr:probable glycosyltransferase BC10 [Coccomyxa sp. Obi]
MAPCFVTKATLTFLLCAWVVPSSRGSLLEKLIWSPDVKASPRRLDEDACVALLKPHIPKVALMFLVRGEVPLVEVWTQWIGNLAGRVPASILCDEELERCYRDMQERKGPPKSVYDEQTFYSIYIHTKPHFPGYESGSIFDGRVVDERVETTWGGHSLIKATRLLMKAALEDPFNERFQLLCEYTIPVRSAFFTHQQLLAQNMSRVGDPYERWEHVEEAGFKWPLAMHEEWPELRHHTRSHSQWVTLIREHAQYTVDDTFVNDLYEKHCFQSDERHATWCIPDEQYFGTLLSWKLGEDLPYGYTDDLAMAPVSDGDGVQPEDIDTEMMIQIRGSTPDKSKLPKYHFHHGECKAVEKPFIRHMSLDYPPEERDAECAQNPRLKDAPNYAESPLFRDCVFFARKFKARTVPVVEKLLKALVII